MVSAISPPSLLFLIYPMLICKLVNETGVNRELTKSLCSLQAVRMGGLQDGIYDSFK